MNKRLWSIIKSLVNVLSQKVSNKTWFGAQGPGLFKPGGLFHPVGIGPGLMKGYGHKDVSSSMSPAMAEQWREWDKAAGSPLGETIFRLKKVTKNSTSKQRYELIFLIRQLQEHRKQLF